LQQLGWTVATSAKNPQKRSSQLPSNQSSVEAGRPPALQTAN
jgi:hypothetical protein